MTYAYDLDKFTVSDAPFCSKVVHGVTTPLRFQFNLNTLERSYSLINTDANPSESCEVMKTSAAKDTVILSFLRNLEQISADPSPVDPKRAQKFLSHVEATENIPGNVFEAVMTLQESIPINFAYFGELDSDGGFHGSAILELLAMESCFKGDCQKESQFKRIVANFNHGVLQGLVIIYHADGERYSYFVAKDGAVHSLVLTFGLRPIYPTVDDPTNYLPYIHARMAEGVAYIAQFKNGKPIGSVWYGLVGVPITAQGFLYGKPNKKGKLTGDDIAYIYPDYKTALVGAFEDRVMKSARLAEISGTACTDGMLQLQFSQPDPNSQDYHYDPVTSTSMGSHWHVKEPFEDMMAELGDSTIPEGGQGIFAKHDIVARKVVSFFKGQIMNQEQIKEANRLCKESMPESKWEICGKYRVRIIL